MNNNIDSNNNGTTVKLPNLSGYVIDINNNVYCSFENNKNLINIYKQVVLKDSNEKQVLINAPKSNKDIDCYAGEIGNSNYEPIGYRIGDLKNSLNCLIFSDFNITEQKSFLSQGDWYFQNFKDIQFELNQHDCLSIGSINVGMDFNGAVRDSQMDGSYDSNWLLPGINKEIYNILHENPVKFANDYCQELNHDYLDLKKYIYKMHSLFNLTIWNINFKQYPSLYFLISTIFKQINIQHQNYNGIAKRLEFIISLPINISDNIKFKQLQHSNQLQLQPPIYFNLIIPDKLNTNNIKTTANDNNQFNSKILNYIKSNQSLIQFLKVIGNEDQKDNETFKNVFLSTTINQIVKIDNEDLFFDESNVKQLSNTIQHNELSGLILNKDRNESNIKNQPPSSINFDKSISSWYSKSNKLNCIQFIEYLNNINKK